MTKSDDAPPEDAYATVQTTLDTLWKQLEGAVKNRNQPLAAVLIMGIEYLIAHQESTSKGTR